MASLSPIHWIIVIVIVLFVFGPLAGGGGGFGGGNGLLARFRWRNSDRGPRS